LHEFEGGSAPMLKVELRSLELGEVVLQELDLASVLGLDLAPELSTGPLEVHCELSKSFDVILAKGWVKGKMLLSCDRCLQSFESGYKSYFELQYRSKIEEEPEQDDDGESIPEFSVETVYFEGDVLDVADQIRQTVLLSVPMRALCRDDCRGLCGGCGKNLNVDSCECTGKPSDDRWAKLKNWKPQ
jgi:uncharacterized protein